MTKKSPPPALIRWGLPIQPLPMQRPQFHTDPMLGDDSLDRKINKAAVTRAWILRHPYYNYRHAPPDADAEEYVRRQSEVQSIDLSFLLN